MSSIYADPKSFYKQGNECVIQNRQVQDGWLQGIDQNEYFNYLYNAMYIIKKQKLIDQQSQQPQYNQYVISEIERVRQKKYSNEELRQLTTSFNQNTSHLEVQLMKPKKMFEMEKIGKKSGSVVRRLIFFENDKLYQLKNNETTKPIKRLLEFPKAFTLQSLDQYENLNAKEKTSQVAWTKGVNKKMSRMIMQLQSRPKGIIVYFDLQEDGIMLRDFLLSMKVKQQFDRFKICLQKISQQICRTTAEKFRQCLQKSIKINAKQFQQELIKKNRFLNYFDSFVLKKFAYTIRDKAYIKKEKEQIRQSQIQQVQQSQIYSSQIQQPLLAQSTKKGQENESNIHSIQQSPSVSVREPANPIYYKQYTNNSFQESNRKQKLDQIGKMNLLQNIKELENYDSNFINNFIYQWRILAQEKQEMIQKQKREIHLILKQIEIDQNLNFIKPLLVVKLKKNSDDEQLRIINGMWQATQGDGEYFNIQLQCKIKSRSDQTQIVWTFQNDELEQQQLDSKQLFQNRFNSQVNSSDNNQSEIKLVIEEYQPSDIIQIELRDQGMNNQEKAYITKQLSELYSDEGIGKLLFVDLDFRDTSLYSHSSISIIQIETYLYPSLYPRSQNLNDDIEALISQNNPIIDPLYGNYVQLPTLTKKDVKSMKNIINKLNLLKNDSCKSTNIQIQSKEAEEMINIKKNLIYFMSKNISLSNSLLKRNIELVVSIEEELLNIKETAPKNLQLHGHPSIPQQTSKDDEKEGQTLFSLLQLYSDRNVLKQISPQTLQKLEKLFKEGLPNYLRLNMWMSISKIQEIKFLYQKANHDFSKIKQIYSINQEVNPFTSTYQKDKFQTTSQYEQILRNSIENLGVIQQEMRENLKCYFSKAIQRTSSQLTFKQIDNILSAYIYWSSIMSKQDSADASADNFIVYSPNLILICDKFGQLALSTNFNQQEHQESEATQQQRIEEDVFWTLISFVYFVLPRYYLFQPINQQNVAGIKDTCTSKQYMPKMYTPQLSSKIIGIKCDMTLLKILLRDLNLDLLKHLNLIGLPIEYYFYNHFLSAFCDLFHLETVYRIWDILYYEASLGSEGHLSYLIISIAYNLLEAAQYDLFLCRNPEQAEQVLNFQAYFAIVPNLFLESVLNLQQKIIQKHSIYMNIMVNFEDELIIYYKNQLSKNCLLNDLTNAKNKFAQCEPVKLSELKQIIQSIYEINGPKRKKGTLIQAKIKQRDSLEIPDQFDEIDYNRYRLKDNTNLQNKTIAAKLYNPYYNTNGLQLPTSKAPSNQSSMHNISNYNSGINQNNHHSIYQNNQLQSYLEFGSTRIQSNSPFPSSKPSAVKQIQIQKFFIYLHQLRLFWSDCSEIQLELVYTEDQKQEFKIIVDTSVPLSCFFPFIYIEGYDKLHMYIYQDDSASKSIVLLNERVPILEAQIDLSQFVNDYVIKTSFYFQQNPNHPYNNLFETNETCIEIDLSILLLSDRLKNQLYLNYVSNEPNSSAVAALQQTQGDFEYPSNHINHFILYGESSLGIDYRVLLNLFQQDIQDTPFSGQISNSVIDPSYKQAWKINSFIKFEEFKELVDKSSKFFSQSNSLFINNNLLRAFFNSYSQISNKHFSLCEALLDLIIFCNSTLLEKLDLVFDLLICFEGVKKNEESISLNSIMEFVKHLYDSYFIYIPDNQIFDMVEYVMTGQISTIVKAQLLVKDSQLNIDITDELIFLMNVKNLQIKSKDFILGDSDNLRILQSLVNHRLQALLNNTQYSQFLIQINYRSEGTLHVYSCLLEKDWSLSKRQTFDELSEMIIRNNPGYKPLQSVMRENQNLLSINVQKTQIKKETFINGILKLPILHHLINYQNSIFNKANQISSLNMQDFSIPQQLNGYFQQIQIVFKVMKNNEEELLKIKFIDNRRECIERYSPESNYYSYTPRSNLDQYPNILKSYIPEQKDYRYKDILILTKQNLFFEIKNKQRIQKELRVHNRQRTLSQSQYINKTVLYLHANPFDTLEEILLNIEILVLKEISNQLDAGYCSLKCLDIENTNIELYLNEGNIMNLLDQSLFKIAHQLPQQEYIYNIIYTYDDCYKLQKQKGMLNIPQNSIKKIDKNFNQLCKYYYSESLSEYIPCKITKKVKKSNDKKIKYYMVTLKNNPQGFALKKPKDVLIVDKSVIDLMPLTALEQLYPQ
ncbi:hypothetical protein ABPG74_001863 [Tetrahymena malaccensis]